MSSDLLRLSSGRLLFFALVCITSWTLFCHHQVSSLPASFPNSVENEGRKLFFPNEDENKEDDGWPWTTYLYIALGCLAGIIVLGCIISYLFCECVKTIICLPLTCLCCCCGD